MEAAAADGDAAAFAAASAAVAVAPAPAGKEVWPRQRPDDLATDLAAALEGGEGADVVFRVGGEEIAAHKLVLRLRAPYFDQLFRTRANPNLVLSSDEDEDVHAAYNIEPGVFRQLLRWIYTRRLPAAPSALASLYAAAQKYELPQLVSATASGLVEGMTTADACAFFALCCDYSDSGSVALQQRCAARVMASPLAIQRTASWHALSVRERARLLERVTVEAFAHGVVQAGGERAAPPPAAAAADLSGFGARAARALMAEEETRAAEGAAVQAASAAGAADLAAALDSGEGADVVFRWPAHDYEIAAHRWLLGVRSPVFNAMFAQHWSASAASGTCAITIEGTPPAVFQQLLRWAYAGQCAEGALGAMADHLFEAAGKYALPALQAAAAQQMIAALAAENVCDFFALAHAHGDAALEEACAALMLANMQEVTRTEGWQRLQAERPLLACKLVEAMGAVTASSRKRGRADR